MHTPDMPPDNDPLFQDVAQILDVNPADLIDHELVASGIKDLETYVNNPAVQAGSRIDSLIESTDYETDKDGSRLTTGLRGQLGEGVRLVSRQETDEYEGSSRIYSITYGGEQVSLAIDINVDNNINYQVSGNCIDRSLDKQEKLAHLEALLDSISQ